MELNNVEFDLSRIGIPCISNCIQVENDDVKDDDKMSKIKVIVLASILFSEDSKISQKEKREALREINRRINMKERQPFIKVSVSDHEFFQRISLGSLDFKKTKRLNYLSLLKTN